MWPIDEIKHRVLSFAVGGADLAALTLVQVGCSITEKKVCNPFSKDNRITADLMLAEMAYEFELKGLPLATKFYRHFLNGSGLPIEIDTMKFLNENPGIIEEFRFKVRNWMDDGVTMSTKENDKDLDLPQYKIPNRDWRNAVGSISLDWVRVNENIVNVWFNNLYQWHPDAKRATQRLHQALNRLNFVGYAKNFDMIGSTINIYIPSKETPLYRQYKKKFQTNNNL